MTKKLSRNTGKKMAAKPKSISSKEKTTTNQVLGLDGNQLLEAINKDSDDTPMKLCVSSAMHEKTQEQLNWSSQQLWEKADSKQKPQPKIQMEDMEDILGGHPQSPS